LNDEEDNDEDDKSDTEDDALPDFFTEYWDVLEEEHLLVKQPFLQEHPFVYHCMVSFTLFTFASVSQITDRMLSSVDQPKSARGGRDMISSNLAGDGSDGLCSFYKLILCTYFSKHRAAFQPAVSSFFFLNLGKMTQSRTHSLYTHFAYIFLHLQFLAGADHW
jgi:hypothetical protein